MMKNIVVIFTWLLFSGFHGFGQQQHAHHEMKEDPVTDSDFQPVMSGLRALTGALKLAGIALNKSDSARLQTLMSSPPDSVTIQQIQDLLDHYTLIAVTINPEARVSVTDAAAERSATQNEWKAFLVKVVNEAGLTGPLNITSENALRPYHSPSWLPKVDSNDVIAPAESKNRFLQLEAITPKPLQTHLSGAKIEYRIFKMHFSEPGVKEISLAADAGKGTRDLAGRNGTRLRFRVRKAVRIILTIQDADQPAMASITITGLEQHENNLSSYYPLPAARVAAYDEYPDFYFQPQIYRGDGEDLFLAPGRYLLSYGNGPESLLQQDTINVPEQTEPLHLTLKLKYWFRPAAFHYYSSDHHVHAAGCSHYDSPQEGVNPHDMWRQQVGEDLNISANLAWGPSWYHQKMFFTGRDETYSTTRNILHNDVEVSGFPSSHCGHIVLLGLKEDDYPGTTTIEQWPSWTAPILQWAKTQDAVVGYAHSGWGLEPDKPTDSVFNYQLPKMDGVGANEFIATVTQHLIDFYSLGDTPAQWELNMLYHTWNCGFRTKLSGETDFPCISDNRVGQGRSYFKTASGKLSYKDWLSAIRTGSLYVGDGRSHILDFKINGSDQDLLTMETAGPVAKISARVAAFLPLEQSEAEKKIAASPSWEEPYWNIEKARAGKSRKVKVECIMNGACVDSVFIEADGQLQNVSFSVPVTRSAWFALRIFPSAHSNAIFLQLKNRPVFERKSAEWCIAALKKCWQEKSKAIRPAELKAAEAFYQQAQRYYESLKE